MERSKKNEEVEIPKNESTPNCNRQQEIISYLMRYLGNAILEYKNAPKIMDELIHPWELINCEILAAQKSINLVKDHNDFIRLLNQPLREWPIQWDDAIGFDLNFQFLLQNIYNPEILDNIPSNPDISGEIIQFSMMKVRNLLMQSPNGQEKYADFRKFVIKSGPMPREQMQKKIKRLNIDPAAFTIINEEIFHPILEGITEARRCSYCGYIHVNPRKCKCTLRCRWNNATFDVVDTEMKDWVQVSEAILRYTVIPGIPEIDLYEKLSSMGFFSNVSLYPNFDEADIEIIWHSKEKWAIDVKDWKIPSDLAKQIDKDAETQIHQKWQEFYYVVPDYLIRQCPNYIRQLKNSLQNSSTGYKIVSITEFLSIVRSQSTPQKELV